jgi:hypothetical protein
MRRRRRTLPLSFALLVAALVATLPLERASTQRGEVHPVIARFAGTYRNTAPDGGESSIRAAIKDGTKSMRKVRRKVARRRLLAVSPPIPRLVIEPHQDGLHTDYGPKRANRTPRLGVFADSRAADGGKVEVMHQIDGRRLREIYRESEGGAVHLFHLSADGRELILEVTITSGQLPGPITYRLLFERASD